MIYANTAKEIEARRRAFLRKWRLKCRAVADSLEEAGERLFTFTRLSESHMWTSGNRGRERKALIVLRSGRCRSAVRTWEAARWPDLLEWTFRRS
jgi:transposase-like protein